MQKLASEHRDPRDFPIISLNNRYSEKYKTNVISDEIPILTHRNNNINVTGWFFAS